MKIVLRLALFLALILSFGFSDAPEIIRLEVRPTEIHLQPGQTTRFKVVAENPTALAMKDLQLQWLLPVGVEATLIGSTEAHPLDAYAALEWNVEIHVREDSQGGDIQFQVTGLRTVQVGDKASQVDFSAFITAKVTVDPLVSVDDRASLELKTDALSMSDLQSGKIYLLVKNKGTVELQLEQIQTTSSENFTFTVKDLKLPLTLKPGHTEIIEVDFSPPDRIQPR